MFKAAIALFEESVREYKLQRVESKDIKENIREIQKDIIEIKTKVK